MKNFYNMLAVPVGVVQAEIKEQYLFFQAASAKVEILPQPITRYAAGNYSHTLIESMEVKDD